MLAYAWRQCKYLPFSPFSCVLARARAAGRSQPEEGALDEARLKLPVFCSHIREWDNKYHRAFSGRTEVLTQVGLPLLAFFLISIKLKS